MKIAIQGHPTRGKEVIQILESLGGKNVEGLTGTYETFYYIDDKNEIGDDHKKNISPTYKLYTLKEFKKEFLFKIGDRVISKTTDFIGTITKFKGNGCYYVKYDNGNLACAFGQNLELFKEMKEERNIKLTLDKAKEWYKKGGELKEVALQAFNEKELNPLPRSWEEFCKNYPTKNGECYINSCSDTVMTSEYAEGRDIEMNKNVCPSQKSAEAYLAMIQLEQLRNCWWNGWKPEWNSCQKHAIKWEGDNLTIFITTRIHAFLVFPTREMAEEFLKCFRDLIEKAGDLI